MEDKQKQVGRGDDRRMFSNLFADLLLAGLPGLGRPGLRMPFKDAGRGGDGLDDEALGGLLHRCDDGDCHFCDELFGPKAEEQPKTDEHIFAEGKLQGSQSEVVYFKKQVANLQKKNRQLTEQLEAAETKGKNDDRVIKTLGDGNKRLGNHIAELNTKKVELYQLVKRLREQLEDTNQKADIRYTAIEKIIDQLAAAAANKKAVKGRLQEYLDNIRQIIMPLQQ
ncbi:MAG: hypothetical protein V1701_11825 [Planctomycetota bacterium]